MNRRSFLRGLLAVPVVAALAPLIPARPRLWGDGFHDDADALQALIDRSGDVAVIPPGNYFVGRSLDFSGSRAVRLVVQGSHFRYPDTLTFLFVGRAVTYGKRIPVLAIRNYFEPVHMT